jgi:hypothetical protein
MTPAPKHIWALADRRRYWQDEPPQNGQHVGHWTEYIRTDALPDMIAPLDFHESMQQASFANSAVGTYAYSPSRKIPGYVEMRIMGQRVLGNYPTEAEAIEKANADHRALIMAAFQTPTITP